MGHNDQNIEETQKKGITFFKPTDVKSVKDILSAAELSNVQKQINVLTKNLKGLMDILRGSALFLRNGKLSTGHVSFAAFRVETLSLIFEYAQKFMKSYGKDDLYNTFLQALGHEVGFTYGREILRNLRSAHCIPADDLALIELWVLYENDTGAGVTSIQKIDTRTFEITLKNNPIGYYYTEDTEHPHCPFYCEYYRAILNEFLTSRPRLARDFMPDLNPIIWKVPHVVEKPRGGICVFEYQIRKERLTRAFDLLYVALTEMDNEKYGDAVASAREALIYAQKDKIFPNAKDVPKNFFKVFQTLLSKRDFKLMDETYQRASAFIHKSKEKDRRAITEIVRNITYCIHEIERLEIDESRLEQIREEMTESVQEERTS